MNNTNRVFGMVTSKSSEFYTDWALKSLFENTRFQSTDSIFLIDNDNSYCRNSHGKLKVLRNQHPLTFAENVNQLIRLAKEKDADLIFLSNDIILTPGWLDPLEQIENAITIPSCNQTHQYSWLKPNMSWEEYDDNFVGLCDISNHHTQQVTGYYDLLLMAFYVFRLPKSVYTVLGEMDTTFVNGGEDLDYRIRAILAGVDVKYAAQSYVLHFNGISTWRKEDPIKLAQHNNAYRNQLSNKWGNDLMNLLVVSGNPNAVLTKHNLMSFNQTTDSHNELIKNIYLLTRNNIAFKLSVVYHKLTSEVRQEIISMWLTEGALDIKEATRRVDEVVVIARNEQNQLVGVTSVQIDMINNTPYYFFRMYVRQQNRNRSIPRSSPVMSNLTVDFLSTYEVTPKPTGVVSILDNPKLSNRIMETFGWNYYGISPIGKSIWYKNFDGSKNDL